MRLGGCLPPPAVGHNRLHRVAADEERAQVLEIVCATVSIRRARQCVVGVKADGERRGSARHGARRANAQGPVKAGALGRIGQGDGERIGHGEGVGGRSRPGAKAPRVGYLCKHVVGPGGQAAEAGGEGGGGEGGAGLGKHRVARAAVSVEPHDVGLDAGDHARIGRDARARDEELAVDRRSHGDVQPGQRRREGDVVEGVIAVGIRAVLIEPDEVEPRRGRPRQPGDAEVGRNGARAGEGKEPQGVPTVGRARGAIIDAVALVCFRRNRRRQTERVRHVQAGHLRAGVVEQRGHEKRFPVARGLGADLLVAGAPVGQARRPAGALGRERRRDACRADGGHAGVHFRHGLGCARGARHRIGRPLERRGRRVECQGQASGGNLDRADRGECVGGRPDRGRAVGRLRVNLVSPFGQRPQRRGERGKRPGGCRGANRPARRVRVEGHGIGVGRGAAGHCARGRERDGFREALPAGGAVEGHGQRRVGHGDGVGGGKNRQPQAVGRHGIDGPEAGTQVDGFGIGSGQGAGQQAVGHVVEAHARVGGAFAGAGAGGERHSGHGAEGLSVDGSVQRAGSRHRRAAGDRQVEIVKVIGVVSAVSRAIIVRPEQIELAAVGPRRGQRQLEAQSPLAGLGEGRDVRPGIGRAPQAVIGAHSAHFFGDKAGPVRDKIIIDLDGRGIAPGVVDEGGHQQRGRVAGGPGLEIPAGTPSRGRRAGGRAGGGAGALAGDAAGGVGLHDPVQAVSGGDGAGRRGGSDSAGGPIRRGRLTGKIVGVTGGAHGGRVGVSCQKQQGGNRCRKGSRGGAMAACLGHGRRGGRAGGAGGGEGARSIPRANSGQMVSAVHVFHP